MRDWLSSSLHGEGEPIFAQENTQKKQDDYYGELSYADIT